MLGPNARKRHWAMPAALGVASLGACTRHDAAGRSGAAAQVFRVSVVQSYPHARDAFTEGLIYDDDWLYESTGLEGRSSLRHIELATGRVAASVNLPTDVFGEGLAAVGERLLQLSWRSGRAFVYDRASLRLEREFTYEGEGWGLCYDGARLIMSDGSNVLSFRDPDTFERTGSVAVLDQGTPIDLLNELECVGGEVYANVWLTRRIARIDVASGAVNAWIDADDILQAAGMGEVDGIDVLNGIAYVPERERLLLTGKFWPWVFEVELAGE
jgi:glutamine cyclotransferase